MVGAGWAKRNSGPNALGTILLVIGDQDKPSRLLARPGTIKLLMSDGSKQVQLDFDTWGRGDEVGGRRTENEDKTHTDGRSNLVASKLYEVVCWAIYI